MRPIPECTCKRGADGQCSACKWTALRTGAKFIKVQKEYFEAIRSVPGELSGTCAKCFFENADTMGASMIGQVRDLDQFVATAIMQGTVNMLAAMGIKEHPLTDQAWRTLCDERGWPA